MPARTQEQGSTGRRVSALLLASCGGGPGRPGTRRADPIALGYRLIWRPALAEIVGDGRPWTVLMISLLSIPWR